MKFLLVLLMIVPSLWGQQLTLSCPASGVQGSVVDCSENGPGGSIAAFQNVITLPATVGQPTVTIGTAAAAAQKQVTCNAVGLCLVTGYSKTVMSPGEWLHFKFTIPATLTGNIQVCVSATQPPVASDPDGVSIPITVGPCVAVSILPSASRCDINGDGQISNSDVDTIIGRILAIPQIPADLNQDGKTDVRDAQIVSAALSGSCLAL